MAAVAVSPDLLATAASDLASLRSTLDASYSAAAAPTREVLPAGADEVSASIADLFSQHGQDYQAVTAQASAYHKQFVQRLTEAADVYASAEANNTSSLQSSAAPAASSGLPTGEQLISLALISWDTFLWQHPFLRSLVDTFLFLALIPVAIPLILLWLGILILDYQTDLPGLNYFG